MFRFMKKRLRKEHVRLVRQNLEMGRELKKFTELSISSGLGDAGAISDVMILGEMIARLTEIESDLERDPELTLPPQMVDDLLVGWKQLREQKDAIEAGKAAFRSRFGRS